METWITELTPLSFLERSAEVHPDTVAVVYGPDRWTYRELAERVQRAGHRPARRRRRSGRPGGLPAAERARDARRALRGPARGRRARGDQHPAVRRGGPLHLRPLRLRAPRGRRRVRADRRARGRLAGDRAHGRHRRRPARPAAGDPIPGAIAYADLLAGAASNDRRRHAAVDRRRRARHDLDQLHVRHHRAAQGRHVHATAARTSTPSARCCTPGTPTTASTCGRCRCSTATAGARRGRWSRSAAPRCACARCAATRSGS